MSMSSDKANTLQALKNWLLDFRCVVEDGTGFRRFLNERLLDPATAAQAAKEAVLDRELGEVREPAGVLEAMMEIDGVPRVAVAAALRKVWLDFGLKFDDTADLATLFVDARQQHQEVLMTSEETRRFQSLPQGVDVFRGQMFADGRHRPSNISWTLSKEVASWYAAPVQAIDQPHGWVLSSQVKKESVIALFLERGEQEVVINPRAFAGHLIRAERGTCDELPQSLTRSRQSA